MTIKYVVVDTNDLVAMGDSFEEAYDWYKDNIGSDPINYCTFYRAELVEVEVKILPKIVEKKST